MSEKQEPWGASSAKAPSTRVSEAQLLELSVWASQLVAGGFTSPGDQGRAGVALDLLASEIRRYRALLIGLEPAVRLALLVSQQFGGDPSACLEAEAEVQEIRAERTP